MKVDKIVVCYGIRHWLCELIQSLSKINFELKINSCGSKEEKSHSLTHVHGISQRTKKVSVFSELNKLTFSSNSHFGYSNGKVLRFPFEGSFNL